ncbi:hypothetical protein [Leeuwenhoekiella sp. LLG6367-2.1]|uniref:hypothetical protein n=1 Tax=Leeuwenhoekiella sp. LLG6367-2.1 TaxID=3160833 RepID=UPI003868ECF9
MRLKPTLYNTMRLTVRLWVFAFTVGSVSLMQAQTKENKLNERFTTGSQVAILADTQYADIVFENWNKNEVAVEAVIEGENISKEEIKQLLKGWQVSVKGNSNVVQIVSRGAPAAINLAPGDGQMRSVNDLIASSMQMMQRSGMDNMLSPMLEQFSGMQLPVEYSKGMKNISFDYNAYKRDGEKYLEQYKKKIEANFGEDFDAVMKKWERNNQKKVAAGQGVAGSSLLGMPKSPFGKQLSFDADAYKRDKKGYLAAINKKYGTNVSVAQTDKWRSDMEAWGADFNKDMQAWGERFGKQFGGSSEALGANFSKALESDMAALGQNIGKAMEGWSDNFAKKLEQMAEEQGGNLKKTVTRDANGNVSTQMTYSYSGNTVANNAKPRASYKRKIIVHMPNAAKLDLTVRHGNINIAEATNAKVNLSHGDFIANKISGDKTFINVAYSPVDIATWDYGTLQASYTKKCVIDKANSININSRASSIVIKELQDAAVITGSFGELSIPKLGKNFKTLNISVENSDVVLNLPETPFHFNFNGVRSRLNYPKSIDAKVMEGYNSSMVNGFYKSRNTDSIIAISSKFSDIVLN